jgi:hypothetical protein
MPLTFQYTFLLIAAGALLIPGRARRFGLLGLVPLGLGVAATTVRLGNEFSDLALRAAERGAPLRFLQINSGLVLLGLVLVVVAIVVSLVGADGKDGRALRAPARWIGILLVAGGAAPMVGAHLPLLTYIGWLSSVGAAIGIGAGAVTLFILGRLLRIGRGFAWLDHQILERNPPPLTPAGNTRFDVVWVTGFFVSAVVMAITPSLRAFALAAVVAGTVGHVLMRRLGGGSAIPVTSLFSLLMIPVYQTIATIAGSAAPRIDELTAGPVSIAAENMIVPWLALAAWGFAGLWPLHGWVFPLVAPLSGILLIRLGAGALPTGMDHWAPLFMPLALLGVWHVVASPGVRLTRSRRLIEILVALSFLGVFAGGDGVVGAYWLLAAAALVPWVGFLAEGPVSLGEAARLTWLPVAWGALLVVTGGLASQVTYTALAAAGIGAAIWVYHTPE